MREIRDLQWRMVYILPFSCLSYTFKPVSSIQMTPCHGLPESRMLDAGGVSEEWAVQRHEECSLHSQHCLPGVLLPSKCGQSNKMYCATQDNNLAFYVTSTSVFKSAARKQFSGKCRSHTIQTVSNFVGAAALLSIQSAGPNNKPCTACCALCCFSES